MESSYLHPACSKECLVQSKICFYFGQRFEMKLKVMCVIFFRCLNTFSSPCLICRDDIRRFEALCAFQTLLCSFEQPTSQSIIDSTNGVNLGRDYPFVRPMADWGFLIAVNIAEITRFTFKRKTNF